MHLVEGRLVWHEKASYGFRVQHSRTTRKVGGSRCLVLV